MSFLKSEMFNRLFVFVVTDPNLGYFHSGGDHLFDPKIEFALDYLERELSTPEFSGLYGTKSRGPGSLPPDVFKTAKPLARSLKVLWPNHKKVQLHFRGRNFIYLQRAVWTFASPISYSATYLTNIYTNIVCLMITFLVLFDFSKAFDKIKHSNLRLFPGDRRTIYLS